MNTLGFSLAAVTTLEPSTEESVWEVKYNEKGVYKVSNENDVIKASSSRENAGYSLYTSSSLLASLLSLTLVSVL